MRFQTTTSPHVTPNNEVSHLMRQVLLALVPGTVVAIGFFGWGVLINILLAVAVGLLAEALMLAVRGRPLRPFLSDGSVIVTAWLLAVCLPPLAPWWLPVVGVVFAVVVAKHLYGGLGYNLFNPAMVGYVVLLISFPREMTQWMLPHGLAPASLSLPEALGVVFSGQLPPSMVWDAISAATPLNTYKTEIGQGHPLSIIQQAPTFGWLGGTGWEWVAAGWLLGGLWMMLRGVISWRIPTTMLGAFTLLALGFHLYDPERFASPLFHLFSGGVMLGAFFIATDPVSGSTTQRGQLIFGAGVGVLGYFIRTFAGYPDGVAFAVLLMNIAAPLIDHYTPARAFGREVDRS
ncbi:MAG: electron transport complex subunit RsxD [Halothiobacillaceae bacterium]